MSRSRPLLALASAVLLGTAFVWATEEPPKQEAPAKKPVLGDVVVRTPAPPRVLAGRTDREGRPVEVACSTCHTTRSPNRANRAEDLDEFHQGLRFAHGKQSCLACHDARDYDQLHGAAGEAISFEEGILLCGQCHGPQLRDYRHGAHGGMTGYWDLERGGRQRNTCVDCHDPHAPAYPTVQPVFPPASDTRDE